VSKLTIEWLENLFLQYPIQGTIISSVVYNDAEIENWLRRHSFFIQLNYQTPIPIQNDYKTPQTLGNDRLAAAVGAFALYPNENCLIVDAGTCITYEFIDAKGAYKGGSIAPGMTMRFRSMHEFTAKLPLVEKQRLDSFIGFNTETSMRTGAQLGLCLEIEGFFRLYQRAFGQVRLILTGGDAEIIAQHLEEKAIVHREIVLIGLNKILDYNVKQLEKLG
jgi:type III pantothenate kinase